MAPIEQKIKSLCDLKLFSYIDSIVIFFHFPSNQINLKTENYFLPCDVHRVVKSAK